MKNAKSSEAWKDIEKLSDTEKAVVEKILDTYATNAENEGIPTATVNTAAVVEFKTEEDRQSFIHALQAKGYDYTAYPNKLAVRVVIDQTIDFDSQEEFDEMSEARAKEITGEWTLDDMDECADFCDIAPEKTTVYTNELTTAPGEVNLDMTFSFNMGRVNSGDPDAKEEFISTYDPYDAEIKAYELGEFVTKVQALEKTAIGQLFTGLFKNFDISALLNLL